jgi:hypothetical protein
VIDVELPKYPLKKREASLEIYSHINIKKLNSNKQKKLKIALIFRELGDFLEFLISWLRVDAIRGQEVQHFLPPARLS